MTSRPATARRKTAVFPLRNRSRFIWFMRLFALGYWLFVRSLQTADLNWLGIPFNPIIDWIIGLFHPSVLLHLLPLLFGWLAAHFTTLYIIQRLYELPDRATARDFLPQRRATAKTPLLINSERLAKRESILLRVGGPGTIRITSGNVATTELNGRFYRTLGAGRHQLHRFERIHTLIDLHPQERSAENVQFNTKEGIPVHTNISLVYRLSTGEDPPTKANPFPYSKTAVRQAAYNITVKQGGEISSWQDTPLGSARSILANILARYSLNELLQPENPENDPHHTIKNELERQLRTSLNKQGIDLLRLRLGQFKLEQQVTDQFIKYWQSHWQKQSQIIRADGAANALEEIEVARAEAEITMLRAVLEGLQRAQQASNIDNMSEIFALHLLEHLEKVAWQSRQIEPLPNRLLPQLKELQQLIAPQKE